MAAKRPRRKVREYLIRQKTDYQTALARRSIELIRDGLGPEHSPDRLAGFTLGKLLLRRRQDYRDQTGISERQFDAGCEWAALVYRYAAIVGFKVSVGSPGFDMVGRGGISCAPELDDDEAKDIKARYLTCHDALLDGMSPRVLRLAWGVCIDNWPVGTLAGEDFGHLREGLNALDRCLAKR